MKRVLSASIMAAAFAVGLAAQTTPPQTTPPSQPPTSQPSMADRDSAKNVTVTGCLKAGDSPDSFTLSDIKWTTRDSKSGGAVGTSGSGAPAGLSSATSLKVLPSSGAKLSEHVGHQIEVTGTISDKDKSSSPSPAPADPAGARPSSSASTPAIEARSVKMVAASCSQ